jgi:hypothetical protein
MMEMAGANVVFSRVREITDPFGMMLKISVEPHPVAALVAHERLDQADRTSVLLDCYGAELLSGYIMAARLALPDALPEESCGGRFPSRLRLTQYPKVTIEIRQSDVGRLFEIPAPFWDKLYAELCMVLAHARGLSRASAALVH